jgi:hypothetical protein
LIKSAFASSNHCSRLLTVVNFDLTSSIETFVPACRLYGCQVLRFFQTESIASDFSYCVPRTASLINLLISLPLHSPPSPTWLTSVCDAQTSKSILGILGAGPLFIGLSPSTLPCHIALLSVVLLSFFLPFSSYFSLRLATIFV